MQKRTFRICAAAAVALSLLATGADARGGGGHGGGGFGGGGHLGGFGGGHMGGLGGGLGGAHMGGLGRGAGGASMARGFAAGHTFGTTGPRFAGGFPLHRIGRHGVRHLRGGFVGPGFYDDDYDDYGYGCPYLYGPTYPNQYPWFAGCS